jgi:hypothetical protein
MVKGGIRIQNLIVFFNFVPVSGCMRRLCNFCFCLSIYVFLPVILLILSAQAKWNIVRLILFQTLSSCLYVMAKIPKSNLSRNQVGITSQIHKWANTDPRKYRRWNQVPRRSKHPLPTGHTRREPSSIIVNADLSAVKVSVSSAV